MSDRVIPLRAGRFVRSRGGIVRGDELVSLSPSEIKLLLYLADHPSEELSYERLLTEVFGYRPGVESRTVYSTVGRLRQKIERDASAPEHLLAVPGVGYKFVLHEARLLPSEPDPTRLLVGREAELSELLSLLSSPGVVSVVGVGGVGKSRLAEEALERLTPRLPGGVLHVELATVSDEDQMVAAICAALGLTGSQKRRERAGRALSERGRCVVLLDEAERVAGRMNAVEEIGRRAPEASFLVTSRLPCGIAGERVMKLGPLGTPASLELLRIRAPGKARGEEEALRALCEAVDGIPLAIELASRSLGILSPADITRRLRRDLASKAAADAGEDRHASLQATLQLSLQLLQDDERLCLVAASVFAGSFDLEAAEALLPGESIVELLDVLQSCGLVADRPDGRLALLETVKAFASGLRESVLGSERALAQERAHGELYARRHDLADQTERSPRVAAGIHLLTIEQPEIAAGLERALSRGDLELAARLGAARLMLWQQTMPDRATLSLAERLLEAGVSGPARSRVAYLRGVMLWSSGRLPEAEAQYRATLAIAETPVQQAMIYSALGLTLSALGRGEEALAAHERAVEGMRAHGAPERLSRALVHLGAAYGSADRFDDAAKIYEEALAHARASGLAMYEAGACGALVPLAVFRGRPAEALRHAQRAVELAARSGQGKEMILAKLHLVDASRISGLVEEALVLSREVVTQARAFGQPSSEGWARLYASRALLTAGRLEEAALEAYAAADALRTASQIAVEGWALAIAALALWRLERLTDAQQAADNAIERLSGRDDVLLGVALAQRAAIRARRGEVDPEIARALSLVHGTSRWEHEALARALAAAALSDLGRGDDAEALLREVDALLRERGFVPPGGLEVVRASRR